MTAMSLQAQQSPFERDTSKSKSVKQKEKPNIGVAMVQVQPEFPGGEDSLMSFLKRNLHYPESAKLKGAHGSVLVGFVVDRTGIIRDAEILNGVNEEMNAEAIRVIKSMPLWKPGTIGGSPSDVQYALSIDFTMGR
jgi:TonB family protein